MILFLKFNIMKKIIFILLLYLPLTSGAYHWQAFTPDTIHALTVCFDIGWPTAVGTTKGLLINDGPSYSWVSYNYGLPVWDIIADPDSSGIFILVMGNGSYSDGIYKFYIATHTYRVLEWVAIPTFIKFNLSDHRFYAGTRFVGMKTSTDGIHWSDVAYFSGKAASAMDIFENHISVVQENNLFATFYSNDTGRTWQQSVSSIPIHDLAYDRSGKLYGVYTGMSNSSGLYISVNYGESWNLAQYDMGMNTIGFDVVGNVFIGWHTPAGLTKGIGAYDSTGHDFNFLNETLPCKNINKIKINPIMASIAIFACTDSGVYFCNNYTGELGIKEETLTDKVIAYPNPSTDRIHLLFRDVSEGEVTIYNSEGQIIKSIYVKSPEIQIIKDETGSGLFYYRLRNTSKQVAAGKFLFL